MFHTAPRIPVRSLTLLFSSLFASLAPAVARTITVDCNENKVSDALKMLDPDVSNTIRVIGTCHDSIAVNNFAQVTIAGVSTGGQNAAIQSLNGGGNAGAGVVIDGNSEASFWGGGTFTGNKSMDVYCGALNGLAAAPQRATIGVTNCPNTYN